MFSHQIPPPLILVHVNSYHYKEKIKALGGKWQPEYKGWKMPNQQAYDQAYELGESVDENQDIRSAYYTQFNPQDFDIAVESKTLLILLKENVGKPIRSGQKFLQGNNPGYKDNVWIVVSKHDTWGDGNFDIVCESLTISGVELCLSEDEIRTHPWTGFDQREARLRFECRQSEARIL